MREAEGGSGLPRKERQDHPFREEYSRRGNILYKGGRKRKSRHEGGGQGSTTGTSLP